MGDYFPTDVSVRLDGDRFAAQMRRGEARSLLFKALLMAQASDGKPVQLTQRVGDADFISVLILGDQKIVDIYCAPSVPVPDVPIPVEPPPELKVPPPGSSLYMLTGIARGPSQVVDEDDKTYLHDFRPTPRTAAAWHVTNAYHDNLKLGDGVSQIQQHKASEYSGAMKRVVQAVYGLGKITDTSGYYLTPPSAATRSVPMVYSPSSTQTHGIYKSGPKKHWLVEISASRGILAMPLPLIPRTRGAGYRQLLERKGDSGGLAVVNEFGGLPSGETFPTGTDLDDAIADGKVLRLKTASELDSFYATIFGGARTILEGWAFSESGSQAHNVRFVYRKIPGDDKYSLSGEHWGITITLSDYNLHPGPGIPVGTGSASLGRYSTGRIAKDAMRNFWISNTDERVSCPLNSYAALDVMDVDPLISDVGENYEGWGAVLHVFFRGETLERVKYVPQYCWQEWRKSQPVVANAITKKYADAGFLYGTCYTRQMQWGSIMSPAAIVSSTVDLRILEVSQRDWNPTQEEMGLSVEFVTEYTQDGDPNPFLPGKLASWTYEQGVGSYNSGLQNCSPRFFAIVPGGTREAAVLCRFTAQLTGIPATMTAIGIFADIGTFQVLCDEGHISRPVYSRPFFFGAVVNAGPSLAYGMTRGIAVQPFTGAPVSPGYTYTGLLPDTGSVSVRQLNFIGGY